MASARRKLKKLYARFERAAQKRDAATIRKIVRTAPHLHPFEGGAGGLVEILDRDAPELLEVAMEAGLHPDAGQSRTCQTVLQRAAADGDLERLRLLLRFGADPEKRNDWGETALGYACTWGQFEAVKLLIEAGAEPNAMEVRPETGHRRTALDSAHPFPEISTYLRNRGARTLAELDAEC